MNTTNYKGLFLSLFLLLSVGIQAQNAKRESLLITNHSMIGITTTELVDDYISILPYSGMGLQLRNTSRRLWNLEHPEWTVLSDLELKLGVTSNLPQTAYITYSGVLFGWGVQRRYKWGKSLSLLVGGVWDGMLNYRETNRDVNNFANTDVSTNLNAAVTFWYDLVEVDRTIRFSLDFKAPLVGGMFLPQRGASYYEVFLLENFEDVLHLTSLHNKNALRSQFTIQIPLNRLRLELGMQYDLYKYHLANAHFKQESWNVQVGVGYDFRLFGGSKNPAPGMLIGSETKNEQ